MSLYHTKLGITVTCKLSLRISELVPVREDGTMLRESSVRHTTNPAMQFTICYAQFFYLFLMVIIYSTLIRGKRVVPLHSGQVLGTYLNMFPISIFPLPSQRLQVE